MRFIFLLGAFLLAQFNVQGQACDCPYPIIFLHGYTGNQSSYVGTYDDANFKAIWGNHSDIFNAVLNANTQTNIWGNDGIPENGDDDVLVFFGNEPNIMVPGCVYSINFENYWNEDPNNPQILVNDGSSPSLISSDSNESSIYKQGYALGKMIESVLASNPDKDKVIVVGHSMGGLETREYLQRLDGNGDHIWWVNPGQADGHQIKKMVTTTTPHLGSNLFGNPWSIKGEEEPDVFSRDGIPDINSEATRDLRYNYAFDPLDPWNCGAFGNCPGPYLFGGDEDYPWGYWNHDINCDGDENDFIEGINQAGGGDAWDGTVDNPALPLPLTLRYTWITSDVGTGDDLVVDLARQWIYNGSTPVPSDGTAYRLTDTLLTDVDHLSVDDDVDAVVRGLDEGDYPEFAWDIQLDHPTPYAGVGQVRSANAPDGPNTSDPDWFRFNIPAGTTDNICIQFTPNPNLSGKIDYFMSPGSYDDMSVAGDQTIVFGSASPQVIITLVSGQYVAGGDNYFRIIHDNVGYADWKIPYKIQPISKLVVPVTLLSLRADQKGKDVRVKWSTASEINNDKFIIERSFNNRDWSSIGEVKGSGTTTDETSYWFDDMDPNLGKNFYRLNQIDFDGGNEQSYTVQCNFNLGDPTSVVFFPNPVENQLNFQVRNLNEAFDLEIFNSLGQVVFSQSYSSSAEETSTYTIPFSDFAAGHYLIRVASGNHVIVTSQLVKR